jgi:hypothetical protein
MQKLSVFGSLVYLHIPNEITKGKFDTRTKKCIMLGYCPNGYQLWSPEDRKIVSGRDVIFDESKTIHSQGFMNNDLGSDGEDETESGNEEEEDNQERSQTEEEDGQNSRTAEKTRGKSKGQSIWKITLFWLCMLNPSLRMFQNVLKIFLVGQTKTSGSKL